jgi:Api92-like protein with ferredoxin domain
MPNHVTTVLTITGPDQDIETFTRLHILPKPDGEEFDFQSIVPAPACIEGTESSNVAEEGFFALTGLTSTRFARFDGAATHIFERRAKEGFDVNALTGPEDLRAWLAIHHPDVLEKGQKMLTCFRETGCLSWYEWKSQHWGTKWGAYQYKRRSREPGKLVFVFQTAWSVPAPILEKLAEMHHTLWFDTESVDEGGPHWVGHYGGTVRWLEKVPETRERYVRVYGREPYSDEDDGAESLH